jgi:hypothetical protein
MINKAPVFSSRTYTGQEFSLLATLTLSAFFAFPLTRKFEQKTDALK